MIAFKQKITMQKSRDDQLKDAWDNMICSKKVDMSSWVDLIDSNFPRSKNVSFRMTMDETTWDRN